MRHPAGRMVIVSVLFYACFVAFSQALDTKDVVFIVISQSNKYHRSLAENLKDNIEKQSELLFGQESPPIVHLSHIDFPHVGGWTILPLIPYLSNLHRGNCSWFFFAEDKTRIKLSKLLEILRKYDPSEEIWLGYALHDLEPTIIHHFAFFENPDHFKYPNTAAGFAISAKLMKNLSNQWKHRDASTTDFSIDHAYELASFIRNKNQGPILKHEPAFCITEGENCATFPLPFTPCGKLMPKESIYFAVKTCKKFHKERVSVVKHTWGRQAELIHFFSDVDDDEVPTITLGIPNTERGHCRKTMAIIKYVANDIKKRPDIKWLFLADDDTILSVARLQELLSCYDPSTSIAMGERYGYNIYNSQGYNYITGGGGIVLSRPLLEKLITCECPSISSPDDMFLGVCIARLGIDVTHSSVFHQARPMDYPPEYLETQRAVSFHKHWMVNPISVYEEWFSEADSRLTHSKHTEL